MTSESHYGAPSGAVAANEPPTGGADRRQQLDEVKGTAREETRRTVDSARQQAGRVGDEATAQAQDVLAEARQHLRGQAQEQTGHLAELLRTFGDNIEALLDGRAQEAGAVADYAEEALQRVRTWAEQVDDRGVDGLLQDVQRFARRRPGAFLAAAAGAGFVVGRLGRGARDAQQHDEHRAAVRTTSPAASAAPMTGTAVAAAPIAPPATGPAGTEMPAPDPDPSTTRFPPEDR